MKLNQIHDFIFSIFSYNYSPPPLKMEILKKGTKIPTLTIVTN